MSEVRLYVDEDAGEHAVVLGLCARGIDVLTTIEAHRCGTSDQEQLGSRPGKGGPFIRSTWEISLGYTTSISCTAWTIAVSSYCPISACPIGEKIRRVAAFISKVTAEEMINRMEYL